MCVCVRACVCVCELTVMKRECQCLGVPASGPGSRESGSAQPNLPIRHHGRAEPAPTCDCPSCVPIGSQITEPLANAESRQESTNRQPSPTAPKLGGEREGSDGESEAVSVLGVTRGRARQAEGKGKEGKER